MTEELSLTDLECLAWVAEGRASLVPDPVAMRLLQQGLVRKPQRHPEAAAALELTPAGLAHVRSSDQ
jgi:hypothetical protein